MKQQITVNAKNIIAQPNPNMWGIFFEEINHAGDGGLYAEQIRNRAFADSNLPERTVYSVGKAQTKKGFDIKFDTSDPLPGWRLKKGYGAEASISKTVDNPRNPGVPEQLQLNINIPGEGVRLINQGYWGFSRDPKGYHGFIIIKSDSIKTLRLGLAHKNGIIITAVDIADISDAFKKFEFSLDANHSKDAQFFIDVNARGIINFDFVSLFPNSTFGGKQYGLRNDLVEALRGLEPGFVRFPGGCVVEGVNLDNAIHWKETIGPIEDRRGHWDLWGYRCTDGLGMHEFLLLCEDLNADAMYVCNCGMSCQVRKPEYSNDIPYWVQNTLDAIEYAVGDLTTKWGAERAKNGHPDPFNLRYVEIGNENSGEEYFERYKIFYDAIHQKYPALELIANTRVPGAPNDIIDDHYYTDSNIFPNIYDKYVKEDQRGSRIYVGEYACICSEAGYGNLLSAISEACFMVGMEQSADVVRIASFAPLFCNENNRNWGVNLINFDKDTAYGIPSYYVQQLFSKYNPQAVFEVKCDTPEHSLSRLFVSAGITQDELIIKVACFGAEDISADIEIRGIALSGPASEIVIAGEKETDTNSVVSPFEVSPVTCQKSLDGKRLTHTFPAYSFTVFRIKTAKE